MNMILFLEIVLAGILFVILIIFFRYYKAMRKAKRICKYAIEPINYSSISYSDKIVLKYYSFIQKIRPYIRKSSYFKQRSKKYDKYIKYKNRDKIYAIDYITNKVLIAMVFIILTIFSQVFTQKDFNIFDYIINFLLGYYILDIYLYFYGRKKNKLIENDLLRAIIIMNNAFKAGKSTLQALEIAKEELPNPIKDEFKKMYLDMKFGLSVDTVFERFAKRVDLKEAVYLSSSLTILNKTGGDIVEVFSSIERTLMDKKKLDEEMKNISANPNMVVKILFLIPIIFTAIIYFLNPSYFNPLFSSLLGYIIIGIIVIMFIIYTLLLRKIMKIEV